MTMDADRIKELGAELAETIRAVEALDVRREKIYARQYEIIAELRKGPADAPALADIVAAGREAGKFVRGASEAAARGTASVPALREHWDRRMLEQESLERDAATHQERAAARETGEGTFVLTPLADQTLTRLRLEEVASSTKEETS